MGLITTAAEFIARSFWLLEQEMGSSDEEIAYFVMELGWILPDEIPDGLRDLQESINLVSTALLNLDEQRQLQSEGLASDSDVAEATAVLVADVTILSAGFQFLPDLLRSQLPDQYLAATAIADEFVKRFYDWLLLRNLAQQHMVTHDLFVLLGLVEISAEAADPQKHQPDFIKHTIRWERMWQLFLKPMRHFREVYGWGTPDIDAERLFSAIMNLSFSMGLPAELHYPINSFIQAVAPDGIVPEDTGPDPQLWFPFVWTESVNAFLVTYVLPKAAADELQGLATTLVLSPEIESTIPLWNDVKLHIEGAANVGTGAALVVRPNVSPSVMLDAFESAQAFTSGKIGLRFSYSNDQSQLILGEKESSHLKAQELYLSGLVKGSASGNLEALIEVGILKGKLVVNLTEADGFISQVLPSEPVGIDLDIASGLSSSKGFYVNGAAGLEHTFLVNKSYSIITILSISLGIKATEEYLDIITAVSGLTEIGPVSAVIQDIGMKTSLEYGKPGLFGSTAVSINFLPPSGIGLAIEAEGIIGGGFLKIDPPNYAGMLQLSYRNEIDLTAFALITTELPDGQDGFSLVIQILAEFQPIQIGLGFALTGVGGLIGINRQLNEEGMKHAFKTHALDAFLFPKNPIKDAVKIIESIQSVMPPRDGFHVFGPMVQLYWGGSVRLVQFEVGVFIQIGGPLKIVVIGQAWSHLPQGDNPRLMINVDVLGIIDFGEERLAINAVLYDSKILSYTLDGQMAIRADWSSGEENFALSLGGFHPRFQDIPPGFPDLRHLVVAIGSGNPRLTLSMYLAITPNTLQVGARLELWAKKKGFTITGGASFDALFTFSPFSFLVIISIWVNIKRGFIDLGAWLELELSGPNPLIASGYVKFKVGWFSKKVRFRKQFGDKKPEPLPEVSPLAALRAELENERTIRFQLPSWASANFIFAETAESKIDPLADIIISQNAVPLNLTLERFGGGRPPNGEEKLSVTAGLGDEKESSTQALFAPEQFKNWSDDERLSAKPFEKFDAGIRFSGDYVIPEAHLVQRKVEYETVLRESRSYRQTLAVNDFRTLAVRTTCVWQPTEVEAEFFVNWSLPGSGTFFKPLRKTKDKHHPNYVHVSDPQFSLSNGKVKDGQFEEAMVDGEIGEGMSLAEAIGTRKRIGLGQVFVRDRKDVGKLE